MSQLVFKICLSFLLGLTLCAALEKPTLAVTSSNNLEPETTTTQLISPEILKGGATAPGWTSNQGQKSSSFQNQWQICDYSADFPPQSGCSCTQVDPHCMFDFQLKTNASVPEYWKVNVQIEGYLLDTLDRDGVGGCQYTDTVDFYLFGQNVGHFYKSLFNAGPRDYGGSTNVNDETMSIDQTFTQSGNSVDIEIISHHDEPPWNEGQSIQMVQVTTYNCDHTCGTCSGAATKCTSCPQNSNRQLQGGTCPCSNGYYDDGALDCKECSYTCGACSGNSNTCTSCPSKSNRYASGKSCPCKNGYFDDGKAVCEECSYSCATCLGSASNCHSCPEGSNRQLSKGQCQCEEGFQDDGHSVDCQKIPFQNGEHLDCVALFSECNFKGESLEVCNSIPDLQKTDWDFRPVKSIYVPAGVEVSLWSKDDYEGATQKFSSTQICINVDLHLVMQGQSKKHLKRNNEGILLSKIEVTHIKE